jgi:hypothetical protein
MFLDAILDKVLLVHIGQISNKTDIWKQDINRLLCIQFAHRVCYLHIGRFGMSTPQEVH